MVGTSFTTFLQTVLPIDQLSSRLRSYQEIEMLLDDHHIEKARIFRHVCQSRFGLTEVSDKVEPRARRAIARTWEQ